MVGRVALGRISATSVLADYERLFSAIERPIPPHNTAHIHIVLTRRLPYPGSSAPPWQTAAALHLLHKWGYSGLSYSMSHADPGDWHGHMAILQSSLPTPTAIPHVPESADLLIVLASLHCNSIGTSILSLLPKRWRTTGSNKPVLVILDGTTIGNPLFSAVSFPQVGNLLLAGSDLGALADTVAFLLGTTARSSPILPVMGDTDLLLQRFIVPVPTPLDRFRMRYLQPFAYNQRWTARERQFYASWLYDTQWGQLFRSYQLRQAVRGAQ